MSQVDNLIITRSLTTMEGIATRIESIFAAVASSNSGATAPASPSRGMLWVDTSLSPVVALKVYNGTTGWVTLATINESTGLLTIAAVTSITAGTGLTGGTITSTGTIAVDVGTTANKIVQLDGSGKIPTSTFPYTIGTSANNLVQLDGSAKLPAVDGSQLTGVSAGALKLLATTNASGASSVVFSSTYITSTYKGYVIHFSGVYGSSNGAHILLTFSTDNGSTYLNANYKYTNMWIANSSGLVNGQTNTSSSISLTDGTGGVSSTSTNQTAGTINIYEPTSSITSNVLFSLNITNSTQVIVSGSGQNTGTTAINNIKIAPSAGTLTGTFKLYGVS